MNNVRIFDNSNLLYEATANLIIGLSKENIARNGKFTMALSGGNTPKKLYELLAQSPSSQLLDWKNIFVFWSDERYVPFADENNNAQMAITALLSKVAIPAGNIFRIPVNPDPANAAAAYAQTIQRFFKDSMPQFDLILLGLGEDGHTASLFPYTPVLKEISSPIKEVFIGEHNAYRISFTASLINRAKDILFMVTGKEKASIVEKIFSPDYDPEKYPAQLIKPQDGTLTWYIDKQSASRLKN